MNLLIFFAGDLHCINIRMFINSSVGTALCETRHKFNLKVRNVLSNELFKTKNASASISDIFVKFIKELKR